MSGSIQLVTLTGSLQAPSGSETRCGGKNHRYRRKVTSTFLSRNWRRRLGMPR